MPKVEISKSVEVAEQTVHEGDIIHSASGTVYMAVQVESGVLKLVGLNSGNRLFDRGCFKRGEKLSTVLTLNDMNETSKLIKRCHYNLTLEY